MRAVIDQERRPRVAEFFAGIGLVRMGLERAGFEVIWANDIEPVKRRMYARNFDAGHFVLGDVTDPTQVDGRDVPDVDLATASFPCTDLSLAGNRAGLVGEQSGAFWGFIRVLREMKGRRPPAVLLENVPSFATSHKGKDLVRAIEALNDLGYSCDMFVQDARRFVPQSRSRLFIVGLASPPKEPLDWSSPNIRPPWMPKFVHQHPELRLHCKRLRLPARARRDTLAEVVQRLPATAPEWWPADRLGQFVSSLSPLQAARLEVRKTDAALNWATAYRRTRRGTATWEIRKDDIAGCLRTARGGSSKQALVEAGQGEVRVRWMTPREYARLQGAGDFDLSGVSVNQALFGLGDAVCVPVIEWVAREYLMVSLNSYQPNASLLTHA